MTTNERRAAWRQYACALLASRERNLVDECDLADSWLESESSRFSTADDELRLARAHALEQQTRAENAEMALRMATRQSQHVASVPTVPVAELHTLLSVYEGASDGPADYVTEERLGALAAYQLIAGNLRALITAAEQRAAVAKPAEGGEP